MTEWHGTADVPLANDIESAPVPASKELLHSGYVTLPAAEVALLTRIAEVAAQYSRKHLPVYRLELFRLANEWRIEWKNKHHT